MNKIDKFIKRVFITSIVAFIYCVLWMLLEKIIDGQIADRLVDNIMMLLFIPIIFYSTKNVIK